MSQEKILIVEDEDEIQELVRYHLSREGYRISSVSTGEEALTATKSGPFDLVILDLMLPGLDGLEVCRALKNDYNTQNTSVVMLTAKGEEADIVTGLELGADDYVTKPFSPRVLVARIRAILRRKTNSTLEDPSTIMLHEVTIHPGRHEVLVREKPVPLTPTEFGVLHALARRPGWVLSREQISEAARGADYPATDRSIDVQVVGLRKKLGPAGKYIETVRGVGYKFKE